MSKELAMRTLAYLIAHYKEHEETIINSEEIQAIEFLQQENQKYKEVIDKAIECIKNFLCTEEYINVNGIAIADNYSEVLEILKEVK